VRSASTVRARTAALSAAESPLSTSYMIAAPGRMGPSSRLASPVRWISDIMSVGTLACSSAAARKASSSTIGASDGRRPMCA
jgi:hypothetical protein